MPDVDIPLTTHSFHLTFVRRYIESSLVLQFPFSNMAVDDQGPAVHIYQAEGRSPAEPVASNDPLLLLGRADWVYFFGFGLVRHRCV